MRSGGGCLRAAGPSGAPGRHDSWPVPRLRAQVLRAPPKPFALQLAKAGRLSAAGASASPVEAAGIEVGVGGC